MVHRTCNGAQYRQMANEFCRKHIWANDDTSDVLSSLMELHYGTNSLRIFIGLLPEIG